MKRSKVFSTMAAATVAAMTLAAWGGGSGTAEEPAAGGAAEASAAAGGEGGEVDVSDAETLEKLDRIDDKPTLIAVAAYVGKTRLIDNTILNKVKKKDGAAPQ